MTTDHKRLVPTYRAPRGAVELVTVPVLQYLMVDGEGDPNTCDAYRDALATLYPVAYKVKALCRAQGEDHTVMPLEALWWADDMAAFTTAREKSRWAWTVMIMMPGTVTPGVVEAARDAVRAAGRGPSLDALRLETLDEGLCVQTLHVGPYDAEGPVLARMHDEHVAARGLRMRGRHHEIYLGDPRRTAPERLRTILRQPVSPARTSATG